MVREVDPELPVYDMSTIRADIARFFWPVQVFGTLFGIFAIIALSLSSMGVYGLIAYSVSRRTREIGIRIALGAEKTDVLRLVLKGALCHLVVGLTLGLAGASAFSRLLHIFMVRVSPTDPHTFVMISVVLVAVTISACAIPAWRAVRLTPVEALRTD